MSLIIGLNHLIKQQFINMFTYNIDVMLYSTAVQNITELIANMDVTIINNCQLAKTAFIKIQILTISA